VVADPRLAARLNGNSLDIWLNRAITAATAADVFAD
jgi:hypothetical protein